MSSVTAIVPVRHDSERVPGKNRRRFCGVPLFERIVRVLEEASSVDSIVVDTDSDEIAGVLADRYPGVSVIWRPDDLLGGDVSVNRILAHDLEQIEGDVFLQTHCTNPLLRPNTIDAAIARFVASERHDSAFGVTRIQSRLYDQRCVALNHDPTVLMRTQDLPPLFEENSNLYLFTRASFGASGARIGLCPMMIEIDRVEAIDIDDESTWILAEAAYRATLGDSDGTGVAA